MFSTSYQAAMTVFVGLQTIFLVVWVVGLIALVKHTKRIEQEIDEQFEEGE